MAKNLIQKLYYNDLKSAYSGFKGVIFDNVIDKIPDLYDYFTEVSLSLDIGERVMISYHNPFWEPVLNLASFVGLRRKMGLQNWIDKEDMHNILALSGFKKIKTSKRFFGITYITTAEKAPPVARKAKDVGVSIIIPARNEAGNIPNIIPSIPKFGKFQEIIYVEGGSTDSTWVKILGELKRHKKGFTNIKAVKQTGKGKANATWEGLSIARGEILMIYDADRTVSAADLKKFYLALLAKPHSFANGNRLLYPMEQDAMRFLNKIGNIFFSKVFTWILKTRFKDTLCGTKAFYAKDFKKFKRSKTDPFGDFDLIFGGIRNKLNFIDIPVRYKERVYGVTNINRFYHGLLLIKMTILAFLEFKLFPR